MANNEVTKKVPTELLCMTLLAERDMYGYEMVQEIVKRSDSMLTLNLATVYVSLRRLSERGYVSLYPSSFEDIHARPRIYYHLEPSAKEYRQRLYEDYQRSVQGTQQFFDQHEKEMQKGRRKK